MGVSGLLKVMQSICRDVQISCYNGKRVAIDGYSWLHKGAYACSTELCQQMLKHYGVIPIVVFDGARLPQKRNEEEERRRKRHENLERAISLLQVGQGAAAADCFKKAVDITPQMAYELCQKLLAEGVEYIVAPYEADAQLAYLARIGYVSCVITEDSDLIVFGCPRIVFKMDKYGSGKELVLNDLAQNTQLDCTDFTHDMVIRMCILAGCDYLQSLPGIGIKRAHGFVKQYKTIEKIIDGMRHKNVTVPENYLDHFVRAEMTFKHQRVYDPRTEKIVCMQELPNNIDPGSVDFLGPLIEEEIAKKLCKCQIDPITYKPFAADQKTQQTGKHQPSIYKYLNITSSKESRKEFQPPRQDKSSSQGSSSASSTTPSPSDGKPLSQEHETRAEQKVVMRSKYFSTVQSTVRESTSQSHSVLSVSSQEEDIRGPPKPVPLQKVLLKRSFIREQFERRNSQRSNSQNSQSTQESSQEVIFQAKKVQETKPQHYEELKRKMKDTVASPVKRAKLTSLSRLRDDLDKPKSNTINSVEDDDEELGAIEISSDDDDNKLEKDISIFSKCFKVINHHKNN